MSQTPEIPVQIPENVNTTESVGEISEAVEKGQPMVQQQTQQLPRPVAQVTTTTQKPAANTSVTIPADPAQLTTLAKGNPVNALTWFAAFWLRIIKKAMSMGASIMTSQSIKIPASNVSAPGSQTLATQNPQSSTPVTSDGFVSNTDQNNQQTQTTQ